MTPILTTHRPWHLRLIDRFQWACLRGRDITPLREADARTLADLGVHLSELSSIDAESQAKADLTRLRIVARSSLG